MSIAAGGQYADKHRSRLLKIFRHFCTDYADAMAEAHVAAQEGDRTTVRSSVERSKPLHGTPVFDREKEHSASTSAGPGQHSGDTNGRSRFERETKQAAAASETLNPGHGSPRKGAVSKSLEGAGSQSSDGTGAETGGKKGPAPPAATSVTSLGGTEEGPGYMTFNDLMRLADKMGLYSPQLNLSKVRDAPILIRCRPWGRTH